MNLEDQICSFEQAKKLKSLGVLIESLYVYIHRDEIKPTNNFFKEVNENSNWYAYTVAELGILLPSNDIYAGKLFNLDFDKVGNQFRVHLESFTFNFPNQWFIAQNEAIAKADCLIWLLEKNLIKVENLKL